MSLEVIKKLKPAKYKYKDVTKGDTARFTLGLMAQDIGEFYPLEEYSILNKDKDGYLMVDYAQLIAPLIIAIQELSDEVEELKNDRP